MNGMTPKHIQRISLNEDVIQFIKSQFSRIDKTSAYKLAVLIFSAETVINIKKFKLNYDSFLSRNKSKFDEIKDEVKNSINYKLKENVIESLKSGLFDLLEKIGTNIRDIEDDDDKWEKSHVNGVEAFEVTKHTTFQDIREKVDNEGKDVIFCYSFKKPDMKVRPYENKSSLQLVDIHVNDSGEYFGFPLEYVYICPECGGLIRNKEYKVASTNNKIKCTEFIEYEDPKNGNIKVKRCNQPLSPDDNRTITKDSYIHSISFKDSDGKIQKAEAITFIKVPKGHVRVVLQKIPRAYGGQFLHIVDYEPIKKIQLQLPKKNGDRHKIFALIKAIDEYIKKSTGYQHYGFLPMKMAMIIQFAARYVPGFDNNFNISMSGEMSSGKSAFARYWGLALYSQDCWSSNATSISIPKLRGTMESFNLFGKEHRYQYKGLLGEKDLIIIDEVKEEPELKNNLKQYGLEPTYEYSKQGSNNQTFERTAHLVVTQNIDISHLHRYTKEIMKIYMSNELTSIDDKDNEPKPAWNYNEDLTLPLYKYENKYLRYAIRKVREDYARNQINWIDGSELALKQRFFFYFYLGSEKTNKELTNVIRKNSTRRIINNNIELMRILGSNNLCEFLSNCKSLYQGKNDLEYFEKIDCLLKKYNIRGDGRTKKVCYDMLKLIRIIDERDYCTDMDLEIFQYIIEVIDNKIEVIDTNEFKIHGPRELNEDDVIEEEQEGGWLN